MSDQVPAKWDATKIQSQRGKLVIVTGANSGIGYVTALELARNGADVVLACRSEDKGKEAVKKIEEEIKGSPDGGHVEFRKLDVSTLASVKTFADDVKTTHDRIDLLINNAGIMPVPYALTVDGIESQFATNHLGHFALTAQLIELLKQSKSARIVNLSSLAHRGAKMDLNEVVTPERKYKEWQVYQNTNLYNLLFTFALNRRFQLKGITNVLVTIAHPGFTASNLATSMMDNANWFVRQLLKLWLKLPVVQTPEFGALPSLYAATAPRVKPDDYFGPDGFGQMTGNPTKEEPRNDSKSATHAAKLWDESEYLAKIKFEI